MCVQCVLEWIPSKGKGKENNTKEKEERTDGGPSGRRRRDRRKKERKKASRRRKWKKKGKAQQISLLRLSESEVNGAASSQASGECIRVNLDTPMNVNSKCFYFSTYFCIAR